MMMLMFMMKLMMLDSSTLYHDGVGGGGGDAAAGWFILMIRIIIMIKIIILTIIIIKTITDIDIEIHSGRSGRNATGRRWAISFKGDYPLMSLKQSNHVIDQIFLESFFSPQFCSSPLLT